MRYQCNVIKDLMPLYHDGICSNSSKGVVEEHFSQCEACRHYYGQMCESDIVEAMSFDGAAELKKAKSIKQVKNKVNKGIVVAVIFAVVIAVAAQILMSRLMEQLNSKTSQSSAITINTDVVAYYELMASYNEYPQNHNNQESQLEQ